MSKMTLNAGEKSPVHIYSFNSQIVPLIDLLFSQFKIGFVDEGFLDREGDNIIFQKNAFRKTGIAT